MSASNVALVGKQDAEQRLKERLEDEAEQRKLEEQAEQRAKSLRSKSLRLATDYLRKSRYTLDVAYIQEYACQFAGFLEQTDQYELRCVALDTAVKHIGQGSARRTPIQITEMAEAFYAFLALEV